MMLANGFPPWDKHTGLKMWGQKYVKPAGAGCLLAFGGLWRLEAGCGGLCWKALAAIYTIIRFILDPVSRASILETSIVSFVDLTYFNVR